MNNVDVDYSFATKDAYGNVTMINPCCPVADCRDCRFNDTCYLEHENNPDL